MEIESPTLGPQNLDTDHMYNLYMLPPQERYHIATCTGQVWLMML